MEYIEGIKTTIENTVNEYKDDTPLEKQLDNANNDTPSYHIFAERIISLKKELEKIFQYRTQGANIRSKSQWAEFSQY